VEGFTPGIMPFAPSGPPPAFKFVPDEFVNPRADSTSHATSLKMVHSSQR